MSKQLSFVLNPAQSEKCVSLAKAANVSRGYVLLGRGIITNPFLNAFGLKHKGKQILSYLIKDEEEEKLLDYFTENLDLEKPSYGIAFTTHAIDADEIISGKTDMDKALKEYKENAMFNKLTVIVDRGMAEEVMTVARNAGAKGGTILHGRGTGAEFTETLLGMEIEPEKELVIILMPSKLMKKAIDDLHDKLGFGGPGKGILYVEPVVSVRGLFETLDGAE